MSFFKSLIAIITLSSSASAIYSTYGIDQDMSIVLRDIYDYKDGNPEKSTILHFLSFATNQSQSLVDEACIKANGSAENVGCMMKMAKACNLNATIAWKRLSFSYGSKRMQSCYDAVPAALKTTVLWRHLHSKSTSFYDSRKGLIWLPKQPFHISEIGKVQAFAQTLAEDFLVELFRFQQFTNHYGANLTYILQYYPNNLGVPRLRHPYFFSWMDNQKVSLAAHLVGMQSLINAMQEAYKNNFTVSPSEKESRFDTHDKALQSGQTLKSDIPSRSVQSAKRGEDRRTPVPPSCSLDSTVSGDDLVQDILVKCLLEVQAICRTYGREPCRNYYLTVYTNSMYKEVGDHCAPWNRDALCDTSVTNVCKLGQGRCMFASLSATYIFAPAGNGVFYVW